MSMLIFYPAPSLSFLVDTSDQKSLNFFQLLEDLVLTRHCLLSFNLVLSVLSLSASPSRRMKKLQLTLEKSLLNNLYPRLVFLPSEMAMNCISESNEMLFNHYCVNLASFYFTGIEN